MIPPVVASDRGRAQTTEVPASVGLSDGAVARKMMTGVLWKVHPQKVKDPYGKSSEA